jgi:hypothetical protein
MMSPRTILMSHKIRPQRDAAVLAALVALPGVLSAQPAQVEGELKPLRKEVKP